jgi:alcohol dehydrogenase class IV
MNLKIPHGHAVALTLPNFFIINSSMENSKINDLRGKTYLKERMEYIFELFLYKGATAKECQSEFYNLMDILNLETDLNRLKIKDVGIKTILEAINQDRLSNNPILVSNKDLNKILTNTF